MPALAALLGREHEVTLLTPARLEPELPPAPPGIRRVGVAEPADPHLGGFACPQHAHSAAVLAAIEAAYGDGPGPDLLEAPDYEAESFVALQAARTGHELLARTRFVVRLRGTAEVALLHDDVWPHEEDDLLATYAMERETLLRADRLVYAGGDTHAAYARYYGEGALAPATRVRLPFPALPEPPALVPREPGAPLRLLYAGRLERRKGVLELVEAVLDLPEANVRLTLVGADTPLSPLSQSMRETLMAMAAPDGRIELLDARPREQLQELIACHDVVVLPSRFEWWSNVASEAMHAGSPILATPVGGFLEQVRHGVTGWLAEGTDKQALAAAIARLSADPAGVDAVRASGAPRRQLAALTEPEQVLAGYRELVDAPQRRPRAQAAATPPRVTAVIPTHDAGELVAAAVDSFLAQAGDGDNVVVVDDGSGHESLAALERLRERPRVRVVHRRQGGPAAARNTGIAHAEGDYVLTLDADDVLEPGFLARALATFGADPEISYVVPWMAFEYADGADDPGRSSGWCTLGAGGDRHQARNVVGGSCALFPRRIFSALGYRYCESNPINDDRELLEQLWQDGLPGAVIPDRLVRIRRSATGVTGVHAARKRPASLHEIDARLRARRTRWTAPIA